ncbi:RAMP superfamily CRISPR-associated protein [Roseiflexus sp.]|uniref:RAMP superfamily CRISPR-associated protein n=1 Tax=Roseiflexus sp. TaxID=2562120 RepID=UPI0025F91725|nr:RAMP superfamily CRISPR-associated protein [Roseiflexus sp.]
MTATLRLRTALHVGTGQDSETTDDLLRRDARGRLLIPGTATAGALRSLATRLAPRFRGEQLCQALTGPMTNQACQCLVCRLFGDVNPSEENEEASAARVLVYDAVLADVPGLQIRDGVGIDRVTGAAARRERIKFDYEVLPAGTIFKLRLEIDPRLPDEEKTLPLLASVLAEWEQGRGVVGGRVGRGLGAFDLTDVQWIERDLNQPNVLIDFLHNGPPWDATDGDRNWLYKRVEDARQRVTTNHRNLSTVARSWALAEFTLAATGPFLTHDLMQAGRSGFDHAPLLATYDRGAKPVLPGSGLRGVLRSQAERIARTLATLKAWDDGHDSETRKEKFLTTCPACNPLTTRTDDPVASCNSFIKTLPRAERTTLEHEGADDKLCLACRLFGSPWNGSRLRVEDAPFVGEKVELKALDFLAIDRFTGGGRDTAKFDAVVLWKPKFRVRLFLENPEPWELGWLALMLRDLHDGLTTVGFGAAKGFGRCVIESPRLTFGILHDDDFPLPDSNTHNQAVVAGRRLLQSKNGFSGIYHTFVYDQATDDLKTLAEGWVRAFNNLVDEHRHRFTLQRDSYFEQVNGSWLSDLYPARVS